MQPTTRQAVMVLKANGYDREQVLKDGTGDFRVWERLYYSGRDLGGPDCECNDKPPAMHVHVHEMLAPVGGSSRWLFSVQFKLTGEYGGQWFRLAFDHRGGVLTAADIGRAERVLETAWAGYCKIMDEGERDAV